MNLITGLLQGKLRAALLAFAVMVFAGTTASAQLCVASCFPSYAYGCMYIAAFTCNGTAYSASACGTSDAGTTNNNTNQSFSATPGSTVTWSMTAGNYFGSYYGGYYTIFVDWTNNNSWTQVGGFAYMSVSTSGSFVVPAGTTAGPRRMRVLFSYYGYYGPCVSDYYGDCKDFTLNIGYNNDLALNSIGTSTAAPFAAGSNNILVNVTNGGLNPITAATVNYTVTPSTGSPMSGTATFAGTIAPGGTSTITLVSGYNFPAVGSATVSASVGTVNNTTDGNTANNNANGLLGAGLNGTYTVGGASPDFVSPAQAASQLTAGGTIGPVTFNIRPGTYTENMYIANIPGSTASKPVVFQSENGNKNSVIVQYSYSAAGAITGTTSVGGVPTLRLNNADYVSFKNFTISALNTAASSGMGVEMIGATGGTSGCDNVTFDNMVFNGVASTSFTLGDVFFLSTSNGYHPNLAVTNCTFNQASIPFYHTFAGTTLPAGFNISNNTFSNFGAYAMRLEGTDGATVNGNTWGSNSAALSAGVVFVNHNGLFNFRKNRVAFPINNGISLVTSGSRTGTNQAVFANNYLRVGGSNGIGFNANGSSNAACLHNTVLNTTAGSAYNATSGSSLSTVNNIFMNTGGGAAFTGASGNSANFNNYWTSGGTLAVWNGIGNATIAGHRATSGQDLNTSNVNVNFVDAANNDLSLTLVDVNLYGIGSTSNGTFNSGIRGIVGDDIFGTTRNRSEVFMGAHQIVPVISFNPAPPPTLTGCANQTLTISGNASVTFGAQLSFTWQRNGAPLLDGVNGVSGASTGNLTITNAQPSLNGGDYVLRVTATGGADPLVSSIINVVVNAPIEINAHPASRVICRGNETSMAVVASGTILGYQWQKDGRNIAGATTPIYVISNAGYDMSGRYRCVLSGTCGTTTIASNDAVVYVASNTLIGSSPESIGAAIGSTGYLSVEVNAAAQFPGYSPQFQWYNGSTMLSDNGRISGTTTNQLTIRNMQASDINQNYYCVVTGTCGSETSKTGGFYVSQIAVQNQPMSQEICSGKDGSLMVSATSNIPNVMYTYQWRLNGTAISTSDANYAGANTNSLTIKNASGTLAGDYTVLIKANPTGATILSDVAAVTVISAPVIGTQPQNVTVCSGEKASMTVAATGGTLSYQWKAGGVMIPGATSAMVEIASADMSLNGAKVTCVITNNCGETTSSEAILTVNDKPTITTGPSNTAVVVGSNFVLSVVATNATGYQWKKDGASIPGATTATYTLSSFTPAMAGKYTCDVTNNCGTVTSDAADLTVSGREEEAEAAGFALGNAVPTPTFATARIEFTMPNAQAARIVMHDAFGREVAVLFDGMANAGTTTIAADAAGLSNGVYTYTLVSGQHAITRRMVVTK